MQNIIMCLDSLKKSIEENRLEYIKSKLIMYYEKKDKGSIDVPAFQKAEADIEWIKKNRAINLWYKKLIEAR